MEAENYSIGQMSEITLRVVLGAIFIWAGTMKLLDLDSFVQSVSHFQITPFDQAPWDMWIGYTLPAFEVIVGTCLILGILLKGACFGRALSFENTSLHISILSAMVILAITLMILEISNAKAATVKTD